MKNFFVALGKAILYFLVYFGLQMAVSIAFSMFYSISMYARLAATGDVTDTAEITRMITEKILEQSMTMTLISGILALLTYWIVFLIRKKKFAQEVKLRKIPAKGILAVLLMGITFNIVISTLLATIPFPDAWMETYQQNSSVLTGGNEVISFLATVFMAPVLEEIVFRGLIYDRLKKGMPAVVAAIISSLAFGLMHGTIIWMMYAFVLGVVLVIVFERFHSLLANMFLHFGFNLTGMCLNHAQGMSEVAGWILTGVCVIGFIASIVWMVRMTKE
ncbi:MAG: CPBP family intramembrane metalloprotease [Roseburia sp.]|nr:CPBP family intramembrane metalloprotease [Roseburia sp.]